MNINETKKKQVEPFKVATGINLSSIVLTHANRFFFLGSAEGDLPGSIRILPYPLTA